VGALCVLDSAPRDLDDAQLAILRELASWAQSELNSRAELDRAAEVQRAMLPPDSAREIDGYRITGGCWPARSVGGDFLDWYRTPDGDLVGTLGDVMGKGIAAALMAATVRSVMRTAGRDHEPSAAMVEAARALEADLGRSDTLVTLHHLRVTPRTGRLLAVDAGHGLALTVRGDGTVQRPGPGGSLPLGVLPGEVWPQTEAFLDPGDAVVVFSDGLLDLFDDVDRACGYVAGIARDPDGVVDRIGALVDRAALADDVTVQVVHRCR
jgi:serine phosphatase RsbU (regulator of sigma subunit)